MININHIGKNVYAKLFRLFSFGIDESEKEVLQEPEPYDATIPIRSIITLKSQLSVLNKRMERDGYPPMTMDIKSEPYSCNFYEKYENCFILHERLYASHQQ